MFSLDLVLSVVRYSSLVLSCVLGLSWCFSYICEVVREVYLTRRMCGSSLRAKDCAVGGRPMFSGLEFYNHFDGHTGSSHREAKHLSNSTAGLLYRTTNDEAT